jgi:hypothetical protein
LNAPNLGCLRQKKYARAKSRPQHTGSTQSVALFTGPDLPEKPRTGKGPETIGGAPGQAEQLGRLPLRQPDKEPLFDQRSAAVVQVAPAAANLVKLRFFAGLTQGRCAEALELSRRTTDNLWAFARP